MLFAFAEAFSESSVVTFGLAGALVMGAISVTVWAVNVRASVISALSKVKELKTAQGTAVGAVRDELRESVDGAKDEMRTTAEHQSAINADLVERLRLVERWQDRQDGKADGARRRTRSPSGP